MFRCPCRLTKWSSVATTADDDATTAAVKMELHCVYVLYVLHCSLQTDERREKGRWTDCRREEGEAAAAFSLLVPIMQPANVYVCVCVKWREQRRRERRERKRQSHKEMVQSVCSILCVVLLQSGEKGMEWRNSSRVVTKEYEENSFFPQLDSLSFLFSLFSHYSQSQRFDDSREQKERERKKEVDSVQSVAWEKKWRTSLTFALAAAGDGSSLFPHLLLPTINQSLFSSPLLFLPVLLSFPFLSFPFLSSSSSSDRRLARIRTRT